MSETTYKLTGSVQSVCDLFQALAGHELLGLSPGEIAKAINVSPAWVSRTLPPLSATGFVEQVPSTNRWRLGVKFVRIGMTVITSHNNAMQQLQDVGRRYSITHQ